MPHFVSVQQSYSGKSGTPEALNALRLCLSYLPESNYTVLTFLIKHLTKVAEEMDKNKMTSVSLSIVFGPNLLHCGEGLEGLRMQGYSNAIVCQMIQYFKELFGAGRKSAGNDTPSKPLPYAEHMANKKERTGDGSHDLDHTLSERSIDEAILDRSNGTLSPTSPNHLPLGMAGIDRLNPGLSNVDL